MKENRKYYICLDIVRIIACALVFLYHLNIINGGFLAVCTFFTISGFLGCFHSLKKEKFSIKSYYANRLEKIYLPLIVVVNLTLIVFKMFPLISWINLKPETLSVVFGYNNYWQISANLDYFTRHISSPFMHMWFIAILLQYELVFPILFMLFKKIDDKANKKITTIAIFLITIASTWFFYYMTKTQDLMIVYYDTFSRLFSILFGVVLAMLCQKHNFRIPKYLEKYKYIIFAFYLICIIAMCFVVTSDSQFVVIEMILTTLITFRLISYASAIINNDESNVTKAIKNLSKITYLIYLVQYPIIFFVQKTLPNNQLNNLIIVCLTIIISLALYCLTVYKNNNKTLKNAKLIVIVVIVLIGAFILIGEKDHTTEMKELEAKLNSSAMMIEQKKNSYVEYITKEQLDWEKELSNLDYEEAQIIEMVHNLPVVGIGDSVLLASADGLYKTFPNGYFDGKVSRTILGGKELLQKLIDEGKLGNVVILALANNGDYIEKRNKDLMEVLKGREVYWVNAVKADVPEFNDLFYEFSKDYDNLHVVDWVRASKDHPEYFYGDGIHVKGEGVNAYAETVFNAICNDYLKEYRAKKDELLREHEDKIKARIVFYGNEALINAYDSFRNFFEDASFNANSNYSFNDIYTDISDKLEADSLEHNIVFVFDQNSNITEKDFEKVIETCPNHKIYICNLTKNTININSSNTCVIDLYEKIYSNQDNLMPNKIHLSSKGNEILANAVYEYLCQK